MHGFSPWLMTPLRSRIMEFTPSKHWKDNMIQGRQTTNWRSRWGDGRVWGALPHHSVPFFKADVYILMNFSTTTTRFPAFLFVSVYIVLFCLFLFLIFVRLGNQYSHAIHWRAAGVHSLCLFFHWFNLSNLGNPVIIRVFYMSGSITKLSVDKAFQTLAHADLLFTFDKSSS